MQRICLQIKAVFNTFKGEVSAINFEQQHGTDRGTIKKKNEETTMNDKSPQLK